MRAACDQRFVLGRDAGPVFRVNPCADLVAGKRLGTLAEAHCRGVLRVDYRVARYGIEIPYRK